VCVYVCVSVGRKGGRRKEGEEEKEEEEEQEKGEEKEEEKEEKAEEEEKELKNLVVLSENPFGGLPAFQNGFARTRSDADASTHKKGARRHAAASDEANADR